MNSLPAITMPSGLCYWFTGLPGAGKSTLAVAFQAALNQRNIQTVVLDADDIRCGLSSDLMYSKADRRENVRRIAEVGRLFAREGFAVLVACISPYRSDRELAAGIFGKDNFFEVHVAAEFSTCKLRDPKGLYASAVAGHLTGLTGWDDPYEVPNSADVIIDTGLVSVAGSLEFLLEHFDLLQRVGRPMVSEVLDAQPQRSESL